MNALQKIQGVTGQQFLPGDSDYPEYETQYASSSHQTDHDMRPGLIVRATSKQDIKLVISQARQLKNSIAIRTGGHQYSGASSTGPGNILLDVRDTFKTPDDLVYFKEASYVRASVSWALDDFNAFLGKNQCFVPHGQCQSVHVGGHMQTGGYGQLGRSFGLFGDHITSFEIIDYEGKEREITRADTELFFAWLGGSPGNLGVLTHFSVQVHSDADYIGSRGLKVLHLYSEEKLRKLLGFLTEMSDNDEFPRNYDLCVSVLSAEANIHGYMSGMEDDIAKKHPEVLDQEGAAIWPRMIVVYAQWIPFSPTDKPDDTWFERLRLNSWFASKVQVKPVSELQAGWIFRHDREFEWPYVKRTYLTNSRELSTNGWVEWVVERMNEVMEPLFNGMKVSAQLQCFGGKYSRFRTNADNGTSYSWRRDTTLCATIDCFHKPSKRKEAEAWQAVNDKEGLGPNGKYSKEDRRVLWGSYGSFDLDSVWNTYYEDRAKYERLMRARKAADPEGIFTPNTFAVKRAA